MSNDLFRVTVILNVQGAVLSFLYKNGTDALAAAANLTSSSTASTVYVKDEFGANCTILRSSIVAVHLAELGRQLEGEGEAAYAHATKQAELQRKAQADVRLKSGILVPGGHVGGKQ